MAGAACDMQLLFYTQQRGNRFERLSIGDKKLHGRRPIRIYGNGFLPRFGLGEDGPLHTVLRQHVVGLLFTGHAPAFMPGNDLIGAGRGRDVERSHRLGEFYGVEPHRAGA